MACRPDVVVIDAGHEHERLRDLLKTQRTAVAMHLDRARQIQSNLR